MNPEFIVVHNTANDASAASEINYMINNNKQTSFHYAIDDKEIVQGISEDRNAWHAGDGGRGRGNRRGIAVEICYSRSGGERFIKAEILAAKFIAAKLKERGWGIDRVKKHQDFSGKYCPHRTLDMGWQRFLNMVNIELAGNANSEPALNITVKGRKIDIEHYIKNNKTYVPLREICENLGYSVSWSKERGIVIE